MIDGLEVGGLVTATQRRKSINVVGMPVTKMFDVWMFSFNRSEHPLLVLAVLKKTCRRSIGIRTRLQHTQYMNVVVRTLLFICSNDPASRFINIKTVAFVVNGFEGALSNRD